MKNFIVTVEIDDIITNKLVKAELPKKLNRRLRRKKNEV